MPIRRLPSLALCLVLIVAAAMPRLAVAQPAVPGAPSNLTAAVNGNSLTLNWNAPASGGLPTGYSLLARASAGGPLLVNLPVGNVTSFSAVGPNGVFVLSIAATNASGTGPESSPVTITLPTVPPPPGPPANLVATASGGTASFSWSAPTTGGAVGGYVLQAGLAPGFAVPIASVPVAATGLVIPGVPPGTYYLRVVALNAGGSSAPSNEATLTVAGPTAPAAPTLNPATGSGNTLNLSWSPGLGGTPAFYRLSAFAPGGALLVTVPLSGTSVTFPGVPNGTYDLQLVAVNGVGTSPASNQITVTLPFTAPPPPITPLGADILSSDGGFGSQIALSANGQRVAVSAATTTNGTVRVYERVGGAWVQLGSDIIGESSGDRAGTGIDLNAAGTRLVVGAYLNDGGGMNAGHVRVFDLVGGTWTQVGGDLDGGGANWGLGQSVAISADGSRVVAGAPGVSSTTGRVRVYELVGGTWTLLGQTLSDGNEFASAVDISADGTTIAVSSPSAAGSSRAGTTQVFRLSGGAWVQVGSTLQGEDIADNFGTRLSLSATGARIAVAAEGDDDGGPEAGKVRMFDLVGGTWTQVGADVLGRAGGERLGERLEISADGTRVAATAASFSVARVYGLVNGAWVQVGADITGVPGGAVRAEGLALSADGSTVAAGFVNGTPRRVRLFSIAP